MSIARAAFCLAREWPARLDTICELEGFKEAAAQLRFFIDNATRTLRRKDEVEDRGVLRQIAGHSAPDSPTENIIMKMGKIPKRKSCFGHPRRWKTARRLGPEVLAPEFGDRFQSAVSAKLKK